MTLKVLIADDSPTIQKIVTLAFGCEDATVECASDGATALEIMRTFNPDVVLADIVMPGYSGYEVCERVKEDPALAHIPVVLLTGTFEAYDEAEASRVKCDGRLTKPFDTNELIDTVHSLAKQAATPQNSGTSVETPGMDMQTKAASAFKSPGILGRNALRPQVWDSYLGSDRILDLFDMETITEAEGARVEDCRAAEKVADARRSAPPAEELSEEALNLIVDKVMQRMSAEVIREVAWEVVPDLSENIIRRTIEEQDKG